MIRRYQHQGRRGQVDHAAPGMVRCQLPTNRCQVRVINRDGREIFSAETRNLVEADALAEMAIASVPGIIAYVRTAFGERPYWVEERNS